MSQIYTDMGRNKMVLNRVTIYHSGLSFSLVCVVLSNACSLESFFIYTVSAVLFPPLGYFAWWYETMPPVPLVWILLLYHILFLPEMYIGVDLLRLLRIRCLTSNHSVFLSSVLSSPPCEHKRID